MQLSKSIPVKLRGSIECEGLHKILFWDNKLVLFYASIREFSVTKRDMYHMIQN